MPESCPSETPSSVKICPPTNPSKFSSIPGPISCCIAVVKIERSLRNPTWRLYAEKACSDENLVHFLTDIHDLFPKLVAPHAPYADIAANVGIVLDFFRSKLGNITYLGDLALIYIPEERWPKLLDLDLGSRLPAGYTLSSLSLQDAALVVSTWGYSTKTAGSNEFISDCIQYLPSACVRLEDNGAPISWMLTATSGKMLHLYTVEEHRRKGLGSIVELSLAQKLVAINVRPFKGVFLSNHVSIEMSRKSDFFEVDLEVGYGISRE